MKNAIWCHCSLPKQFTTFFSDFALLQSKIATKTTSGSGFVRIFWPFAIAASPPRAVVLQCHHQRLQINSISIALVHTRVLRRLHVADICQLQPSLAGLNYRICGQPDVWSGRDVDRQDRSSCYAKSHCISSIYSATTSRNVTCYLYNKTLFCHSCVVMKFCMQEPGRHIGL